MNKHTPLTDVELDELERIGKEYGTGSDFLRLISEVHEARRLLREERERIVAVVEKAEGQPLGNDMPEMFLLGFETGFLACQEAILAAISSSGKVGQCR